MAAGVRPENLIRIRPRCQELGSPETRRPQQLRPWGAGGDIRGDAEEVGDELVVFYPTQHVWTSYLVY